jgi:hypothetical protein
MEESTRREFLDSVKGAFALSSSLFAGCAGLGEDENSDLDMSYWSSLERDLNQGFSIRYGGINLLHPNSFNFFEQVEIQDGDLDKAAQDPAKIFLEEVGFDRLKQQMEDKALVSMLEEKEVNVNLVNLDEESSEASIDQVKEAIVGSLDQYLPETYDSNVNVLHQSVEDPSFDRIIEEGLDGIDENEEDHYLYITTNGEGCGASGVAPFRGNKAYADVEGCSRSKQEITSIHELWHTLAYVPHTDIPGHALYPSEINENSSDVKSQELANINQKMVESFFGASLHVKETENGLICRYKPADVDDAEEPFIKNAEHALVDTLGFYEEVSEFEEDWEVDETDLDENYSKVTWIHKKEEATVGLETSLDRMVDGLTPQEYSHELIYELPEGV